MQTLNVFWFITLTYDFYLGMQQLYKFFANTFRTISLEIVLSQKCWSSTITHGTLTLGFSLTFETMKLFSDKFSSFFLLRPVLFWILPSFLNRLIILQMVEKLLFTIFPISLCDFLLFQEEITKSLILKLFFFLFLAIAVCYCNIFFLLDFSYLTKMLSDRYNALC